MKFKETMIIVSVITFCLTGMLIHAGTPSKTINWSFDEEKNIVAEKGVSGAIAMIDGGHCVAVYAGIAGTNVQHLYSRVGKIDFTKKSISWGAQKNYTDGSGNAIALNTFNNKNYCIEVHIEVDNKNRNWFYYTVGTVDYNSKTIKWKKKQPYIEAKSAAVALDNRGNCVEVHIGTGENATNMYYSLGIINVSSGNVKGWKAEKYSIDSMNSIAMDCCGNLLEVHTGGSNLWARVGKINPDTNKIYWPGYTVNEKHYGEGKSTFIALRDNGYFVEVHNKKDSKFYYIAGKIDYINKTVSWGHLRQISTGIAQGVAMDNNGNCIVVYMKPKDKALYYAIGKVQ